MAEHRSRIAVVVNGNAKSVTNDVISTLYQILRGGDLFVSRHIDEASEIAETIIDRSYGTVLTGGGDGTFTVMVTEVVQAARRRKAPLPRFGLMKLGTGNALSWVVGASSLGKNGAHADIQRLLEDTGSRSIRLVEVEGFLTPFAGVGADAQILADYNKTKKFFSRTPLQPLTSGLLGYAVAAATRSLPSYLLSEMSNVRVVNRGAEAYPVDADGTAGKPLPAGTVLYDGPGRLAGLSTIPYFGFGFKMFPWTDLLPDRMQLRVSTLGSWGFVRNVRGIWEGTYCDPRTMFDYLVDRVSIECSPALDFQIGGDSHGKREVVEAQVTREAIQLVDHYASPERIAV